MVLNPIDETGAFRVAVLAPIAWRTPPRRYGPWEQFASLLTEGLVGRGVEVTLFATADSVTTARLIATAPTGYEEDLSLDAKVEEILHIAAVFERAQEFDLIHNSFDFLPLAFTRLVATPVVTTIHGFSSPAIVPVYQDYNADNHYVAISEADRHPALEYVATIPHGIEMDRFHLQTEAGDYLLFYGRIHPDKGTATAIEVARRAGLPLVIAGIIQDRAYFEEEVKPHLGGSMVSYLGPVDRDAGSGVLSSARALLHLIDFEEPFGLSVVEAMATGTPVIASSRGSMPEIVMPGVNGYLTETVEEAVAAVDSCAKLDRIAVRASVENRFSVGRMVEDYLAVYRQILDTDH